MKHTPRKHRFCLLLVVLTMMGCWPSLQVQPTVSKIEVPFRLTDLVVPTRYHLYLDLEPSRAPYSGRVDIELELGADQFHVDLHAKDLVIDGATFKSATGSQALSVIPLGDAMIRVSAKHPLRRGVGTLSLRFSGRLSRVPDGLYRVSEGRDEYIFSQFEPLAARTAFPCFDEPKFKTPFEVSVRTTHGLMVVSNAPERERVNGESQDTIHFLPTRPIPTYLLAFGIGPLEFITASENLGSSVPFRVIVPRGKSSMTGFALKETPPIYAAIREYLDQSYPYQKLDFMAVPNFKAGAMENPGLVTFREPLLLVDEAKVTPGRLQSIRSIIAHELAHMWFGNSLTPEWWDDLWLNEAFATWMADHVLQELTDPHLTNASIARSKQRVMRLDAKKNVRAIRQKIETDGDIENAFDGITYRKGASILWMLEHWLGATVFKSAMRQYVATFRHRVVNTRALLDLLDRVTGKPVRALLQNYLDHPGVPELKFSLQCDASTVTLGVEQHTVRNVSGYALPWTVPVCVRYGVGTRVSRTCFELLDRSATLSLPVDACPDWFYGNADESGYYTWSASPSWHLALTENLSALSVVEKSALPAMFRRLAESGALSLPNYVAALLKFLGSKDLGLKSEALANLTALGGILAGDAETRGVFYEWLATKLQPIWDDVKPTPTAEASVEAVRFRSRVRQILAADAQDDALLSTAHSAFVLALQKDASRWTSDERELFVLGARRASTQELSSLIGQLDNERNPLGRSAMMRALAVSEHASQRARIRAHFLTDNVRAQDFWLVASGLGWRDRDERWRWVQEEIEALETKLTVGGFANLPWITWGYCTEDRATEVGAFFEPYIDAHPALKRSLALVQESILECVRLRNLWSDGLTQLSSI